MRNKDKRLLLFLLQTEDGKCSWQMMSARGWCSELKLLILIITECLRRGVDSECLFNGCLQSEQHQDGARLGACRLFFFPSSFSVFPSSPQLNTDVAQQHTSLCKKQTLHTLCSEQQQKNCVETETNRQGKKGAHKQQQLLAEEPFSVLVFSFVFRQHHLSFSRLRQPEPHRVTLLRQKHRQWFSFQEKSIQWIRSATVKVHDSDNQRQWRSAFVWWKRLWHANYIHLWCSL